MKAVATSLIGGFGEEVSIIPKAGGTPQNVQGFSETYQPDKVGSTFETRSSGENIAVGDLMLLISQADLDSNFIIFPDDRILFAGKTWVVMDVDDTRAQGDSILLSVRCKEIRGVPEARKSFSERQSRI